MQVRYYMLMSRVHHAHMRFLFWLGGVMDSDRIKSMAARKGFDSMKASLKVVQLMKENF